jgi:hypothetical protein
MANQLFVNPFPYGQDNTQRDEIIDGSLVICGSAVSTTVGESINWQNLLSGLGYNESNFRGSGGTQFGLNNGSALVTTFSASAGTVTATANNNFYVGQKVTFLGNTSVLGLLLNGVTVTVVTATSSNFTFLSAATGTGASEVGMAVSGKLFIPNAFIGPTISTAITATSASGGLVTITAANKFQAGANVLFGANGTGTILTALIAAQGSAGYEVVTASATSFTIASAITGTTGTGTVTGNNPAMPYTVDFWSANNSGYNYAYNETTGQLFVQVGGAAISSPMANIAAGAYPAAVLGDIIKYTAKFVRQQ